MRNITTIAVRTKIGNGSRKHLCFFVRMVSGQRVLEEAAERRVCKTGEYIFGTGTQSKDFQI